VVIALPPPRHATTLSPTATCCFILLWVGKAVTVRTTSEILFPTPLIFPSRLDIRPEPHFNINFRLGWPSALYCKYSP